jgi:prepilin-type N-terminal cleavage/methylation domain-containing protein
MKKAFTLIEILIVVIILVIFIWVIWIFLPDNIDKKIKFSQECWNYVYQEILNEKNNIEKNKTINSGWQILSHLSSKITNRKEDKSLIIQRFYENEVTISKNLTNSGWFCLAEHISNKNNYIIKPNEEFWINIQKDNIYSYNKEILSVCDNELNDCIEISKINYNKASNRFEQKFCSSFNSETCNEWLQ